MMITLLIVKLLINIITSLMLYCFLLCYYQLYMSIRKFHDSDTHRLECKRSWHERCVPSAVIGWSRARRGEKSKTQPLSVEDAIDRSSAAVESRTCCLLDSDTNRINNNNENPNSSQQGVGPQTLPAETMCSSKPENKALTNDDTTTINSETEEIRNDNMTSDSNSSIVYAAESPITEKKTISDFISRSPYGTGLLPSFCKLKRGVIPKSRPFIAKGDDGQDKLVSKVTHKAHLPSNKVDLNKAENAWHSTIVAKKAGFFVNVDETDEEINKEVISILNKITPDNISQLTKRFVALSIDTIKRLENTIDLIFEKAIQEQCYAPLYAAVCSAMKSVRVNCAESEKIPSFKRFIIQKCQKLFEMDNTQQIDNVNLLTEIKSCEIPERKIELQLQYEENERRLRKRSVGNCRFIGELFKQNMLNEKIMLHCITNLIIQHSEEPLECLCNILRTTGKELELCCDLNDTFIKLEALASNKSGSKLSSRIRFMILDIMDLRKDKWTPRRLENKPKMIKEIEEEVKNEEIVESMTSTTYQFKKKQRHNCVDKFAGGDVTNYLKYNGNVQPNTENKKEHYTFDRSKLLGIKNFPMMTNLSPSTRWTFSSSPGDSKKCTTPAAANELLPSNSELVSADISGKIFTDNLHFESDSAEVQEKIHTLCKNIIEEYEHTHNLDDVTYSLVEDDNSCIRTRHQQFVTSTILITLNGRPNNRTEAGKMFAELLSKKILSVTVITRGLDTVLKDWNDHLTDYPYFFSYIAAIVAPLLISNTPSFKFFNLKYACASIRPDNSRVFFAEVLQTILGYENTQNVQNVNSNTNNCYYQDFVGTLRAYNMWRLQSKYVPLDVFIPNNQINECFKNDQLGVLLLSMAMYHKTRLIGDNESLYDTTHKWINKNINAEIIKLPCFVRTLIVSTAIVCSNSKKPRDDPKEDFFGRDYVQLLNYYIRSVYTFSTSEIREREVQCIKGSRTISTAIFSEQQDSGDTVLRPFNELCRDGVISRESFDAWNDVEEFDDNSNKSAILSSLFVVAPADTSDERSSL